MSEHTTFSLKSYVLFLLTFIALSVTSMVLNGFSNLTYDIFVIYAIFLISIFLLISNNITGWFLSGLGVIWFMFNPVKHIYLQEGLLFRMMSISSMYTRQAMTFEFVLWTILLLVIIINIIMKMMKSKNIAFEVTFAVYLILFSMFVLTGLFRNLFMLNPVDTLGFYLMPVYVLAGHIFFLYVGYLVSDKN